MAADATTPECDATLEIDRDTDVVRSHQAPERVRRTLAHVDVGSGLGLEIGPLCSPMVDRSMGDVRYVDVDTTDRLREHYAAHPGVPVESIVHVDVPLMADGRVRAISEAMGGAGPRVRWVVASHVVEHVPDLIAWFADLADVLDDDGLVALAVPDRRYSFDACRPATTVGQMLEAHQRGDERPSVRAVFDHHTEAVHVAPAVAWRGLRDGDTTKVHDNEHVLSQMQAAAEGTYVDCHVWLFTPTEFVAQLAALAHLGLLDFVVDHVLSTAVDELEFFVTLRRLPRNIADDRRTEQLRHGFTAPVDSLRPVPEEVVSPDPEPLPRGASVAVVSGAEWVAIQVKRGIGNRLKGLLGTR